MTHSIPLDRNRVTEWEPTVETAHRATYLSGFAVPEAVELRPAGGRFVIAFAYPGTEERVGGLHPLDDGTPPATVRLSKFTQKVLELTADGPATDPVLKSLAERLMAAATDRVPIARRLSYRMSAMVIEKVLLAERPVPELV